MKKKTDWSEWDHLLGTMEDKEIAFMIPCARSCICERRKKLGIPTYSPINWNQWDHLLGTTLDTELARKINCKRQAVTHRRNKLGIKPFASLFQIDWQKWDGLLGTMTDEDLALKMNYCRTCVTKRREQLNIRPFGRVHWEEWDRLLGTLKDEDLAVVIGCSRAGVAFRRKQLGLVRKKIDFTNWSDSLGKISDVELAKLIGCTNNQIGLVRKKLNIPAANWTKEDQNLFDNGLITCIECKITKPTSSFKRKIDRKRKTPVNKPVVVRVCETCIAERDRNRNACKKQKCIALMGGKCQCCGYAERISPLQFHHVEEKQHNLSTLSYRSDSDIVKEEMEKCCLLCSNCHDAYHGGEINIKFVKRNIGWTVSKD